MNRRGSGCCTSAGSTPPLMPKLGPIPQKSWVTSSSALMLRQRGMLRSSNCIVLLDDGRLDAHGRTNPRRFADGKLPSRLPDRSYCRSGSSRAMPWLKRGTPSPAADEAAEELGNDRIDQPLPTSLGILRGAKVGPIQLDVPRLFVQLGARIRPENPDSNQTARFRRRTKNASISGV